LRLARQQAGLRQAEVGRRAGVSQSYLSQAERGLGHDGSVETWAALAAAVGMQLAAFIELAPGATAPRDGQHLARQQHAIRVSAPGGWTGRPEVRIATADGHQRFIVVLLERTATREAVVVEIVDLIADLGEDLRGIERKVDALRVLRPDWRVAGLLIIRGTVRNRAVVRSLGTLLASRFTSGVGWIRALTLGAPLPEGDGILWSGSQRVEWTPVRLPAPGGVSARSVIGRPNSSETDAEGPPPSSGQP